MQDRRLLRAFVGSFEFQIKRTDYKNMVSKTKKTIHLSNEIFNGKAAPDFIKTHRLFNKNPIKITKVFPAIGVPNFKEKANVDKCLVDIKREGSYVHNLLRTMTDILNAVRESLNGQADRLQFLAPKAERDAARDKMADLYNFSSIITTLSTSVDPNNKEVLNKTIHTSEGKIALKLMNDISDLSGKLIYRKDQSLFRIFAGIKEKCVAYGIPCSVLEQTEAFKIFSKENIPNKEFSIVFSAEGTEGAWDILTMSMRGIKSCQRWDGEYPKCLIGSVLSKFVGVIYLTSGVQSDNNLGTKMMRRSVVRYVVDADENKPCILVDKMYPDLDKDILQLFTSAISSKTNLPVYYAPELSNKLRHLYTPSESIQQEILMRECTYQDTPLKSRQDLDVYILNSNKDEVEREIKGFKTNLSLHMARVMDSVYQKYTSVDPEIQKTISNIRMNISFAIFCESLMAYVLNAFRAPSSKQFKNSKDYYRKYLMEFIMKRKDVAKSATQGILAVLNQNTSRVVNTEMFIDYIFSVITDFSKMEAKKLIN